MPQADLGEQVADRDARRLVARIHRAKLRQVDAAVREFPEVDYTYGTVNTGYAIGKNQASLYLRLKPLIRSASARPSSCRTDPRTAGRIPGILVSINVPGGPGGGVQKQLQLSLQGPTSRCSTISSQE